MRIGLSEAENILCGKVRFDGTDGKSSVYDVTMHDLNQPSDQWPKSRGIYSLINRINGKRYVGYTMSSGGFRYRWRSHRTELRRGVHKNRHMQHAYNLYGESSFHWEVLEIIDTDTLKTYLNREARWIDDLDTMSNKDGYNIVSYDDRGSATMSEETKEILSQKATGRKHSAETIKRLTWIRRHRKTTTETRNKMSASMKGKTHTDEAKAKMSASQQGHVKSPHHRGKLSDATRRFAKKMGDNHPSAKIFECIAPDGSHIVIKNMTKYCREHDLCSPHMIDMCNGKRGSCQGYKSLTYQYTRFAERKYDFMSPEGHIFPCYNMEAFGREHGVSSEFLRRIVNGHIPARKKWRLVKDYTKETT